MPISRRKPAVFVLPKPLRHVAIFFAFGCLLASLSSVRAEGTLLPPENAPSKYLSGGRTIRVYLPPSYNNHPRRRYPVLYLQDGQNVFSSAGTNAGFGWGNWQLDKTVDELSAAGKMREIIMVGVDNSPARMTEYSGKTRSGSQITPTAFENYEIFLIKELKPKIDREYRTLPDAADTGVMGSSLGGICSLALAWYHPEVFGRAASLSGSFQIEHGDFLNSVLRGNHGSPKTFRIYLDSGIVDYTGGDDNRALTGKVAGELKRIGWKDDLELFVDAKPLTEAELEKSGLRRDKWKEAQTSQHNEFYWRQRSWRPLTFLFPPTDK